MLAESFANNVEPQLENGSTQTLQGIVERFSNRERLAELPSSTRNCSPSRSPWAAC